MRPSKKCRVGEDDEEGDECMVEQPIQPQPDITEVMEKSSRLALLTVKTSNSTSIKFAVSEGVLMQVPEYDKKMATAISQTPYGKRLRITDAKIRWEESFFQAFEYLTIGVLAELDLSKPQACVETLNEFIHVYELSANLGIVSLEQAIVHHISASDIDIPTFIKFATECFKCHNITEHCLLGQFVKANLAEHLHVLIDSGAIDDIKDAGGTLNRQLVEFFAENYVETQKRQHGKSHSDKIKFKIFD